MPEVGAMCDVSCQRQRTLLLLDQQALLSTFCSSVLSSLLFSADDFVVFLICPRVLRRLFTSSLFHVGTFLSLKFATAVGVDWS
jgi:hypothetical protein